MRKRTLAGRPLLVRTALASTLAACSAGGGDDTGGPAIVQPPGAYASPLEFLLERYDADGDGRVERAEYPRGEEAFARLDRDGDGDLDGDDQGTSAARDERSARRRAERAERLLGRHFQLPEEDVGRLAEGELARTFEAYDADADGRLDEEEFRCEATARALDLPGDGHERIARLMRNVDPWEGLVAGLDGDASGLLERAELEAFLTARGGALAFQGPLPGSAADGLAGDEAGPAAAALRGPRLGTLEGLPAPDFTLPTPDGERTVTLSDFAGERPVALIFGSYT